MNITIKIASQHANEAEEESSGNANWHSTRRAQDRVNPEHYKRHRLCAGAFLSRSIRHGAESIFAAAVSRRSALSLGFLRYIRRRVSQNAPASKRFRRFFRFASGQ